MAQLPRFTVELLADLKSFGHLRPGSDGFTA
jgi:hypothetical protein